MNPEALIEHTCRGFCDELELKPIGEALYSLHTPFYFPDGDAYSLFLERTSGGNLRLTDKGHTLMQVSYYHDVDPLLKGTRYHLLVQALERCGLFYNSATGEIYKEVLPDELLSEIFAFGKAITSLFDLGYLSRERIKSTFYEDLDALVQEIYDELHNTLPDIGLHRDYHEDLIERNGKAEYPIDYYFEARNLPCYLFGIPNKDKARLTTLILERLKRYEKHFQSLLVFEDFDAIGKSDRNRLLDVGGEIITSLSESTELAHKIRHNVKLAHGVALGKN